MSKKPGRVCKICKLKKTHPQAYEKIYNQLLGRSNMSINGLLKILNKEFSINITPMNYQTHKGHTLDENGHELNSTQPDPPPKTTIAPEPEIDIQEAIKNLNPKHKEFCEQYVFKCNRNGTEAYKAVYGTDNVDQTARSGAWIIKTKQNNSIYIKHLEAIRREEIGINENYVLETLKSVVERCMETEPVYDKAGDPTGEYTFNANGANKALSELGKYLGMDKKKDAPVVPPNQAIYIQILEDFMSNKSNALAASVELEKAGIVMPEVLKIAMRKVDPSILDKPPATDSEDMDLYSDEELERIIADGEE